MSIRDTRALLNAALGGDLDSVETRQHPVFNVRVPTSCPDVDPAILDPRGRWGDASAYDVAADRLREMFHANFEKNRFGDFGVAAVM